MSWVEWVFSGAGVAVPIALLGWWYSARRPSIGAGRSIAQKQRGGRGSTNIQIGHDLTVHDPEGDPGER